MLPMMRNAGKGRVQFGSPCAKQGEASAKHPNIRKAILGRMGHYFMQEISGSTTNRPFCNHMWCLTPCLCRGIMPARIGGSACFARATADPLETCRLHRRLMLWHPAGRAEAF